MVLVVYPIMKYIILVFASFILATSVTATGFTMTGPKNSSSASLFIGLSDEYETKQQYYDMTVSQYGTAPVPYIPYARFVGLNIGIAHESKKEVLDFDVCGLQVEFFGGINQDAYGLFIGSLFNISEQLYGWQIAGLVNMATRTRGLQTALAVNTTQDFVGWQASLLYNQADGKGLQTSILFNGTDDSEDSEFAGCQIALINYANRLYGCQIGLINYNAAGIVLPFINIGW